MGQLKGDIYLSAWDTETTTTDSPELLDPYGRTYSKGIIELSRKDRTANGRLVIDIINRKFKITLEYSEIDGSSLTDYEDFFDLDQQLYLTIFTADGVSESYIVIMSPFDRTRWKLGGNGLWSDVSFIFEEV